MITGIGIDITKHVRIAEILARHGDGFRKRIYSARELKDAVDRPAEFHAGRWAAKEAAAKALGCGFCAKCPPNEIIITNGKDGSPKIRFVGKAKKLFEHKAKHAFVSISHEQESAVAMVIMEK
ncbi:MAG: holo-ACP synthase [Victivallaceae bacterium]|nr:holo-ACP synthase [Victivallaceae bacterium]